MDSQTSLEFADAFFKEQVDAHNNPTSRKGFTFPIGWFMKATGGFKRGWFVALKGKAKAGKTSLMITAARQNGIENVKFAYLSMEESNIGLGSRIFAAVSGVSRIKFRDIGLQVNDWPAVQAARVSISNYPARWIYGGTSIPDVVKVINDHDPDVVYIDYLQLMSPQRKANSKTEEVSENSRALKLIANGSWPTLLIKRERCIIVAVQLNDQGEPLWSRDINRDCDLSVQIEPVSDGQGGYLDDVRRLSIDYFRHGGLESQKVGFAGELSLVTEINSIPKAPPLKRGSRP